MAQALSRRNFLKGLAAGAAVVGFDPVHRSWVTSAAAQQSPHNWTDCPPFDGVLYTDDASLSEAADDFGHIIHRRPVAVLKPESVQDVVKMVRFANRYSIKVAMRGQAHSSYGQAQVEAGVVIDSSTLDTIHEIGRDYADVDAGVKWRTLLEKTLERGLTPPVLTDYIELSVGGTLSVGGIGGASHQYGVLLDTALELLVVTGEGDLEWCSARKNRKLFHAVLGGLGQFGIILRARVRLIKAETHARVFLLFYDDINLFTSDQLKLVDSERFNYVEGQVVGNENDGWRFMLEAAFYYSAPQVPDNERLIGDLRFNRGEEQISDQTYFEFANRLEATIEFLKMIGVWGFPHPWFDVFMPSNTINGYVSGILETLTLNDTGQGPILLYPVRTEKFTHPFFRVPEGRHVFLFDILRTAPPVPEVVDYMVASNRALFEQARELGGVRYPMNAIPFTQEDWKRHFGSEWKDFVQAKREYDPRNIMTPGQGIF